MNDYVNVQMIHDLYYGNVLASWSDCGLNRTTKVWSGPIAEVEKLEGIIPIHEIPAIGEVRVNMDIITMAKMIQKLDFGDVAPYTRSTSTVLAIAEWITSNHQMVVPHAIIRAALAGMGMILREQVIGWITPADIPIIAERVLMHHLRTRPKLDFERDCYYVVPPSRFRDSENKLVASIVAGREVRPDTLWYHFNPERIKAPGDYARLLKNLVTLDRHSRRSESVMEEIRYCDMLLAEAWDWLMGDGVSAEKRDEYIRYLVRRHILTTNHIFHIAALYNPHNDKVYWIG